ncbi:hypothetical protein DQG23_16495 [Paenibacillus contaminans]|uniref:Uncharacterized protein n=1 Tax=Paenibacillus contaminans TaxID=450362 RepID=A0A329MJE4_9BACL|nr:hypothetical protein DQG23_16495 [Paenibacillus contaminans]
MLGIHCIHYQGEIWPKRFTTQALIRIITVSEKANIVKQPEEPVICRLLFAFFARTPAGKGSE